MVSVIIPCYNVADYLPECLESVMGQTWKDIEVICVNDGSTDRTPAILEEYQKQYPDKIEIITRKNAGASAARNSGLLKARGEYIQFLDADDLLMAEKIRHQMGLVSKGPDLIAGAYHRSKQAGGKETVKPNSKDVWMGLMTSRMGCTCSNLWKASSLKKAGGWNEEAASSQEYDLMFRLVQANSTVIFDERPLTIIRERRSGSISQGNQARNWERYIQLRVRMLVFMEETGRFTDERSRKEFYQVLFDAIRIYFRFDPENAYDMMKRHIPDDFRPQRSHLTGPVHLLLYRLLGFRRTEKCLAACRNFSS